MFKMLDTPLCRVDPNDVLKALDAFCDNPDVYAIKKYVKRVYGRIGGVTLTSLANQSGGKSYPLVLDMLLGELKGVLTDGNVSLEKYLACSNTGATITSSQHWDKPVILDPSEESLQMLTNSGLRNTVLYLYLISKHTGQ